MPQVTTRHRTTRPRTRRGRVQGRRAHIGITALALMMLLAATSLAIFITITTAVATTRDSRDFVRAMRNLDIAESEALYALNSAPTQTTGDGTGSYHNPAAGYTSMWRWDKTTNAAFGNTGGGRVTMVSVVGDATLERERAWRYRLVGSRTGTTDKPIYGIAAPSAWTSAVSTVEDSWVEGDVDGDWHLYGNGELEVRGATLDRAVAYDDGASIAGTPTEFFRSTLSAKLDAHLVRERVTNCGNDLRRFKSSVDGTTLAAGMAHCYYSITIDEPTTIIGSGIATLVSYGDVDIRADLRTSGGNQLHLYTTSGTVKFRGGGNVDAYIYAPNALCKTWDAQTVTYTGSLVCRQAEMHLNLALPPTMPTLEAAGITGDGAPDHSVSYLELPGYRDRFGN